MSKHQEQASELGRFLSIKEKLDSLQKQADRAQGALDQVLSTIKKEFGCNSLEEAKLLQAKLAKDTSRLESELHKSLLAFEEKHGEMLKGVEDE